MSTNETDFMNYVATMALQDTDLVKQFAAASSPEEVEAILKPIAEALMVKAIRQQSDAIEKVRESKDLQYELHAKLYMKALNGRKATYRRFA